MAVNMKKRLKKEYEEFVKNTPKGMSLDKDTMKDVIDIWQVHVDGAEGTLYAKEKFVLKFVFDEKYPFESPQVTFVPPYVPVHPHVYSNGHICLSILGSDWTPAMNVMSVCLSIQSMLSSAKKKVKPPGDETYSARGQFNPKLTSWGFHDDTC
ncbi:hypothetical protein EMCRGX_G034119 [Ephydatia muelleri]|eukprot:Em0023g29a